MGRLHNGQVMKDPSAKVVGDEKDDGMFCLFDEGQRIEIVQRCLIADDAEDGHRFGKACNRGDIAVDARKSAVSKKSSAILRE